MSRQALVTIYRKQLIERDRLARKANEIARVSNLRDLAKLDAEQKLIAQQAAKAVDPRLKNFFAVLSSQIWRAEDPAGTLQILLCASPIRGAPRRYEYRDFVIATKVAGRMNSGETRDSAVAAVAAEFNMGSDAVLNIYKRRNKVEVQLQLELFGVPAKANPPRSADRRKAG